MRKKPICQAVFSVFTICSKDRKGDSRLRNQREESAFALCAYASQTCVKSFCLKRCSRFRRIFALTMRTDIFQILCKLDACHCGTERCPCLRDGGNPYTGYLGFEARTEIYGIDSQRCAWRRRSCLKRIGTFLPQFFPKRRIDADKKEARRFSSCVFGKLENHPTSGWFSNRFMRFDKVLFVNDYLRELRCPFRLSPAL